MKNNKSEEDDDYIDPPSIKKDNIDSKSHEEIRKRPLFKKKTLKVIDLVMFDIDNDAKEILAVGY